MDWIGYVVIGIVAILIVVVAVIMFAGWVSKNFFGKSEAWLDYGIDEDEM